AARVDDRAAQAGIHAAVRPMDARRTARVLRRAAGRAAPRRARRVPRGGARTILARLSRRAAARLVVAAVGPRRARGVARAERDRHVPSLSLPRVLHVIPSLAPGDGGPSVAAIEMCRSLTAVGVETAI